MCALPKGFIKKLNINKQKVGVERRQEILDDIDNQGTFLPRAISYEDIDKSFVDFIDKGLEIVIDGKKVPVLFLTLQKWSEFSKTWEHSDKYKNIKIPFITIVRNPDVQVGTNQAGNWNIPGNRGYTYLKVPTFEGGRKGIDTYKIPQPTSVDLTYDVRLFTNRMRNLNKFNILILKKFNSRQHYLNINGHPMPLLLESVSDESNIDDFNSRRFYTQTFNMLLSGYILDDKDFEIIPTVNRLRVSEVINGESITPNKTSKVNYKIEFNTFGINEFILPVANYITIDTINELTNIQSYEILINGNVTELPLVITTENLITVRIIRNDENIDAALSLSGSKNT
jgi:hypothetical protein